MKTIRDNWVFVLLAIVAFFLILMLFSVQGAILSQQSGAIPADAGPFYLLRRQIANMIAPPTFTPTPGPPPATLAPASNESVALPTPLPSATPTATTAPTLPPPPPSNIPVLLPTATATVPPTATPTEAPSSTPASTEAIPPTATPAPLLTDTATAAPAADAPGPVTPGAFRLGYVERNDSCTLVTEIVRLAMLEHMGLPVESVAFANSDELFATLAATDPEQRVDLTLCYTDPTDRSYLQKHLGFVLLVGGAYRQSEGKSFVVLSNASIKTVIQREQPCVYSFLTRFRVVEADLLATDASGWLVAHERDLASWTSC